MVVCLSACSSHWLRWEDQQIRYTVQPGDTLYSIAFRHQLDYRDIAWWNGIGRAYTVHTGQVLRLDPPLPGELRTPPRPPVHAPHQPSTPVDRPPSTQRRPAATPAPGRPVVAAPAAGPRRWQWPVKGPVLATYNPAQGRKGLDIGGEQGSPIRAAGPGKVVYAGSALKGYGLLLIIKHDDEYLSAYGHNAKLLVREGDEVKSGDVIARMGLGPQNRPLLHFEIRRLGKPVDPRPLLPPS